MNDEMIADRNKLGCQQSMMEMIGERNSPQRKRTTMETMDVGMMDDENVINW